MSYPSEPNPKKWMKYLGRSLTKQEFRIFMMVNSLKHTNEVLKNILEKFKDKKIMYPVMTDLDGNCMFTSLNYHGIGNSNQDLRELLAHMLYQFKDFKGFLPNFKDQTLEEVFIPFTALDDLKYVLCDEEFKIYRYGYEVMCQELVTKGTYSKFTTEFLLLILSRLYKTRFEIFHEAGIMKIDAWDGFEGEMPELRTVHLALLGEDHYVPVKMFSEDTPQDIIDEYYSNPKLYNEGEKEYEKWVKYMTQKKETDTLDKIEEGPLEKDKSVEEITIETKETISKEEKIEIVSPENNITFTGKEKKDDSKIPPSSV